MNEHPIIFSTEMVRAILAGRKTQSRRVIKPQPPADGRAKPWTYDPDGKPTFALGWRDDHDMTAAAFCLYGQVGARLWVRENGWERPDRTPKMLREGADTWPRYRYDADDCDPDQLRAWGWKRRPSIHMPRWASRITLEVVKVRVERLQEISESDAEAEGVKASDHPVDSARVNFNLLWDTINAKRGFGWNVNPWVWVVQFNVGRPPNADC